MTKALVSLIATVLLGPLLHAQSLTIYTEISPPYQEVGANGKLKGYAIEIVQEIQKRTGNTDPIQVIPWVRGYNEAQAKANVVLFSTARSAERDHLFQWVGPLFDHAYVFYVKCDSKISIHDLEEAKKLGLIGVYKQDIREQFLTHSGFTNLDTSINQEVMFKKLMAGRIDALAASPEAVETIAQAAGYKLQDVRQLFTFLKVHSYIAFSKATPSTTVKAWTVALEAMKQDATFERIFRRYYPNAPLPAAQ